MSVREKWLRFGCSMIGYNFGMLNACSELSKKRVLRYTSALIIVIILWSFIGASFCSRYLLGSTWSCVAAAVVMVLLVTQIERQVILSQKNDKLLHLFRLCVALCMAIIGSVIIDQTIFKDDI